MANNDAVMHDAGQDLMLDQVELPPLQGQQAAQPAQETDAQRANRLEQALRLGHIEQAEQGFFLGVVKQCNFPNFDGKDLDRYSLAMFLGNINMFTEGLPDIVKVKVIVSKSLGQPRLRLMQMHTTTPASTSWEGSVKVLKDMYAAADPAKSAKATLHSGAYTQEMKGTTVSEYVQETISLLHLVDSSISDKAQPS